ncbi:branched-chain amino acid transport protein [Apilactobacillus kunkeei DSM 12361 = ATCC 700308]|uniref:Branched-chain amino acid transport system carrier protein n=1 Tax=Apilactobacillus kunkeei DSM 12361 = ATCC 700308 TaxID=1423768 RepID=A0A0R1FVP1_9LACO|nr:branched-chain amino acid transport system II carrier protein [Apilactobacillus kunkeei]KOY71938.1 Branched chain amino acid ABC superfamily ATP binding cassette transporter carrier protein [Apilactobacillus kunkeei DSM 12361 = ATCC 700308]KRK22599.1 branched-chain amino acid transport protein [Apilactobacillus kunkeei DSM 12361 = ATCC 700308]QYU52913.1 branched-chain amino acid transport system II carrier protein [Apilactobacillus kunkeei]
MEDLNKKPLSFKQYLVVSSLLFALFFGAGNLIFPLHLGQLAGAHWFTAMLGFLCTGVVLPLLSVLAISVTRSKGVYDIGTPLGSTFALVFMVLIHATIGPLFGTPRTATVPFAVGVQPLLPSNFVHYGLLVFSFLFFLAAFLLSYKESSIMASVGKLLNPIFLVLLFVVFFLAFLHPMSSAGIQPVTSAYQNGSFFNGFLEGYNTMDALAGLAFGVTVVTAVNQLGKTNPLSNAKVTAKAGFLAESLVGLIYVVLIWLGATTLGQFKASADGGVAFNQLMTYYLGATGHALLATLLTLTCLTTAMGLVAAFAQDFHKHFPKLSYVQWLGLMCVSSFLTANFGLDTIIQWSTPMLMFLYPFAMVLILLSVFSPLFKRDSAVYFWVVLLTTVPALMDMLASFPPVVSQSAFAKMVGNFQQSYLPLASIGMDWVPFAIVGLLFGLMCHWYKNKKYLQTVTE